MFFYYTVVHFPKDILSNDYKEKYKTGQLFCLGPDEEYDVWYGATIIAGIGDDYFDFLINTFQT